MVGSWHFFEMVPFLRGTSVNFRGVYPRLACKHHHRGLCDWLHHDAGCHVYIFIGTLEYCCGDAGHGHEIAAESAGVSKGKKQMKTVMRSPWLCWII